MGRNWRCTPFAQAVNDGIEAARFDYLTHRQIDAVLDGLDAAGLLLTPERLEEIAQQEQHTGQAEERAAEAFGRAGIRRGSDPSRLDATLALYAERGERDMAAYHTAMHTGRDLPYYPDAYRDVLALTAAFRAAMGYSPTPTARELGDGDG